VQTGYPLLIQYGAMDQNCAFAFQKSYHKSYAILWWNAYAHVNVVRHQMPFQQLHPTLAAQIVQYDTNLFSKFPVQFFLAILGYKYNMVFAIPSYMR
jgi:hypothetical protein